MSEFKEERKTHFSDFPTTVLTVSGSKGMLSVLYSSQNTPDRNNLYYLSIQKRNGKLFTGIEVL